MVKLNKIYTRTGDDGTTGLVRGPRRFKYDLRVACYGTIDEANSVVGVCRLLTTSMPKIDSMLARIQNDLFDLGSDLATPGADAPGTTPSRIKRWPKAVFAARRTRSRSAPQWACMSGKLASLQIAPISPR